MICSPQFRTPMTIVFPHSNGTKDSYLRKEELGHGGFATVYRVIDPKTNQEYAIKVISKSRYEGAKGKKSLEKLKNEILIQKNLNHPNIVRSYGSFEDEFNYYILLEYCPGKNVYDLLLNSEKGYLSEAETRKILQDVVRAVLYLHRKHIIHRDLKLENYMIGADGNVKIADFGISVILKNDDEKRFSLVGTPNYLSPEVLQKVNKGYSYEVDIWSIGVCAFMMLTGHPPFQGVVKRITFEHIKNCDYHFPPEIPISSTARDFIRTILKIDPNRRPTAIDLANHPFMTTFSSEIVHLYRQTSNTTSADDSFSQIQYSTSTNTKNFNSNIPTPIRPRIPLPPTNAHYISRIIQNDYNNDNDFDTKNNQTNNLENTFIIPNVFVTRVTFHDGNMGYLLGNGIVGACLTDKSRIILDPNEKYVQYYRNYSSFPEIINIEKEEESFGDPENESIHKNIALIQRFARSLKTSKLYYQQAHQHLDEYLPLQNVQYFLNKNNNLLFKFNDKNVQVNFNDHMKLIIFNNTKQMCLVRSIRDKCNLISINYSITKNPNSNESRKYMKAKEMLSELY